VSEIDREWAKTVLEWWCDNATACLSPGYSFGPRSQADPLRAKEHQTQVVVQRVLGLEKLPTLMQPAGTREYIVLAPGIDQVKYALGVLATEIETQARVGSSAPVMAADSLHSTIWNAASTLWADGHYGQAVQRAATFLNAHVQDLLNRHDLSDATLMQQAFSLSAPEPGRPRLRYPGKDDDLTVKAMRGGILNFAQGCFMGIRNPATHGSEERPRQIWLEQLATLSTLARWIDDCEVLRAE
jgi:hypothetical protein